DVATARVARPTITPRLHLLQPKELDPADPPREDTPANPFPLNLDPGVPDTSTLINSEWRAAWREASSNPPAHRPAQGLPALRVEIAEHLRRMRGLITDP